MSGTPKFFPRFCPQDSFNSSSPIGAPDLSRGRKPTVYMTTLSP